MSEVHAATHRAFKVTGMHCGGCENKLRHALMAIPGVRKAEVSHTAGHARVEVDERVPTQTLAQAIQSAGDFTAESAEPISISTDGPSSQTVAPESLYPLYLIVGFITGVALLVAYKTDTWALEPIMRHFMAGFFIVFGFFKLLDPAGFVSAYVRYDLLAARARAWAWAYPFIELALGVAYLLAWAPLLVNTVTLVLMLIGSAGVLHALRARRVIRCACLGSALNLPMTKVTLIEDLTMAAMAAAMIVLTLAQ